jgi:exodeoxyribonuclease VII small subunit
VTDPAAEPPGDDPLDDDSVGDDSLDDLAFADAIAELEAILRDLEADDVDIDRLASRVRRATELINLCRRRIAGVEMEITQILDR